MQYLVDTGILLRLFDRSDPHHDSIRQSLRLVRENGHSLLVCPQVIAEFWNVSTRPNSARGGYGQSIPTTERRVRFIEKFSTTIFEHATAYQHWRELLIKHAVQGVAVHDARLVAIMESVGVRHIITLNTSDFARYPAIIAESPSQSIASQASKP